MVSDRQSCRNEGMYTHTTLIGIKIPGALDTNLKTFLKRKINVQIDVYAILVIKVPYYTRSAMVVQSDCTYPRTTA